MLSSFRFSAPSFTPSAAFRPQSFNTVPVRTKWGAMGTFPSKFERRANRKNAKIMAASNTIEYNSIISKLVNKRKFVHCIELYDTMISKGLPFNAHTFGTMIDCFGKKGDVRELFKYWKKLKEEGKIPSVAGYTRLENKLRDELDKKAETMTDADRHDCDMFLEFIKQHVAKE